MLLNIREAALQRTVDFPSDLHLSDIGLPVSRSHITFVERPAGFRSDEECESNEF